MSPKRGEQRILSLQLKICIWRSIRDICSCPFVIHGNHLSVIVCANQPERPERKYVSLRDVREHRKLDLQHKLEPFDWTLIDSCANLDETINLLSDSLKRMHDEICPLIKVKVSFRDPPYMMPLIKYLCRKRNRNIKKGHKAGLLAMDFSKAFDCVSH